MAVRPVIRLKFGDRTFDVVKLMASEVSKIQAWTGCASKNAWIQSLGAQDIDAFRAGYTLMLQREGAEIRFSEADFDTDEMDAVMIEPQSGREIEPVILLDEDGDPLLNSKGAPQVQKDSKGEECWRFVDDGAPVPPTSEA